ncbi:MAG: response regulator [Thermodesulfobacteriota bacterium]|jgi:DNA-binding response OmpR family regulator
MQPASRPTVLLIDEDPDILKLLEYAFADEDLDLICCRTPEAGLGHLAGREVRCILLDMHFARTPECLGFLGALRRLYGQAAPPTLVTSATTGHEIVRQVLDLGARKFIPKPFYPREILEEIRTLVA